MTFIRKRASMKKREPLFWLEVAATLGSLIGGAGLIALLYQDARAADPKPGFTPGGKTFTNPFANQDGNAAAANPQGNFFDDEEDDGQNNSPGGGFPPGGA